MKSIDEAEAKARLDEILNEAEQQPIVIRRQGRDFAAIVSAADYERLRTLVERPELSEPVRTGRS